MYMPYNLTRRESADHHTKVGSNGSWEMCMSMFWATLGTFALGTMLYSMVKCLRSQKCDKSSEKDKDTTETGYYSEEPTETDGLLP
jgi:hypothetical protein